MTGSIALAGDQKPIEVIVGGRLYPSFEQYQSEDDTAQSSNPAPGQSPTVELSEIQNMLDEAVRHSARPLEITLDPKKIKTIELSVDADAQEAMEMPAGPMPKPDPWIDSYKMISKFAFNEGIHSVIKDFNLNGPNTAQVIKAADLEQVLRDSFANVNQPLLLLSDEDSVRIMVLEPDARESTESTLISEQHKTPQNPQ